MENFAYKTCQNESGFNYERTKRVSEAINVKEYHGGIYTEFFAH